MVDLAKGRSPGQGQIERSSPTFASKHRERVGAGRVLTEFANDGGHGCRQLVGLGEGTPYSGGISRALPARRRSGRRR